MKIILLLMSIIASICSCENNGYTPSDKQTLANEVRKKAATKIHRGKQELYPFGSGGQMIDKIKMLALSFECRKTLEIEEARQMLIWAATQFTNEVNNEKRIHQYLNNIPFNAENIEIMIFIKNPDRSTVFQGNLRVVSMINGVLKYSIGDPETDLLKTTYKETYEEALQKLEAQSVAKSTLEHTAA